MLDSTTYLERLAVVDNKVTNGESIDGCDRPEVGDIQLEYDFTGAESFTVDHAYTFDFTPLANQFNPTKTYVVCVYLEWDGLHGIDCEVSRITLDCTRAAYTH